ncbi:MAG: MBL fold metallo-hydrolase [Ornithinimicrobium sp.]
MTAFLSRRLLLRSGLGGMTIGAVATLAACSSTSESDAEATAEGAEQDGDSAAQSATAAPASSWERVNLGFVSAYVFVRGGQAAVVDAGTQGSQDDIEAVLAGLDVGWEDVSDVILTHSHPDHIGSAAAIAQAAADAAFHAGEGDLSAIDIGRDVMGLRDGDSVFDLSIIATPGHTPGHVCVHDRVNGVLVAGDALTGAQGGVDLPNPEFTPEYEEALRSVDYLGTFDFETALFGHGEPVSEGAAEQVRGLSLG